MEKQIYEVGQIVRMKKNHPCGSDLWEVQRVGMDFRIMCKGCSRSVMISRKIFEQKVKEIVTESAE